MSVLDRIATARDDLFAARVAMITMTLAIGAVNENVLTPNHANRVTFARLHFKALVNTKSLAAAVIASNATIQNTIDANPALKGSNVPDSDLLFVLTSLYDAFANAYS